MLLGSGSLACGGSGTGSVDGGLDAAAGSDRPADAGDGAATAAGDAAPVLTALPIGDGKYGSSARVGYIFSCQTTFGGIGGAQADGPWVKSDGTFDGTAKIVVEGAVSWPTHAYSATITGGSRVITGNDLPDHTTGIFPIASTDPAYVYDRNPNTISAQAIAWTVPTTPAIAAAPSCLSGGPIGIMDTGAVLFDALDGEGRDALAHEIQDACQAHPEMDGEYHYHSLTSCIADPGSGHSARLGYARDGFGIYGERGENGEVLTDADLDECHGHTHAIDWDGATVTMYHYHATREYPYTLGCYRGTPQ